MSFNTRTEFIKAMASEKTVLAHLQATSRLYTWSVYSGSVYSRVTDYFVIALKQEQSELTKVSSIGAVVAGTYYYDILTSTVYVHTNGSVDPSTVQMIVTYQFYFSNSTLNAPHDLTNTGHHVLYEGRINSNPGYKHKIGIEQALTSLVGTGDLKLENNDGSLDSIFDTLFFENQLCLIYSWNKDLPYEDAKLIYKGRVTNKAYDSDTVTFTIKDQMFDLLQTIPQNIYSEDDGVNEDDLGKAKRWVYGRVDGMKIQSLDQIGNGISITGTLSGTLDSKTITGSGTSFLSELSPDDEIVIGEQEFTIESIASNTSMEVNTASEASFTGQTGTVIPSIPVTSKNRTFLITDHACTTITKTVVSIVQTNRVELNNTTGLYAGDYLEFDNGERIQIKNIAPGNIVVLVRSLISSPSISSDVVRQPIQGLFVEGHEVIYENYTIDNQGAPNNWLKVTLSTDAEFTIARARDLNVSLVFTNGSRTITTADNVDLSQLIKPRDWIRPAGIAYTTYYEVLSVDAQTLEIRTTFTDPNTTDIVQIKSPNYIGDDTIVSVNVLGRTEDGEPESTWLRSGAQVVKDIARSVGLTNFNDTSFSDASTACPQLISLALPTTEGGKLTSAKVAIDLINQSIFGSLTLDDNLDMQYRIMKNDIPSDIQVIKDSDVVSWRIKTTNGKNFRNVIVTYRNQDYNANTLTKGESVVSYSSEFVRDYIGTNQTDENAVYLYDDLDAEIMAHRLTYFNRLGRSDITIETDLRFESLEIGDTIQLEFDRLYKRFGDTETRKKIMLVTGLTKSGEKLTIDATDLNNTFNSSTIITPNDASDYVDASVDEKLKYGYITTNQGIVNDEETTSNINLIS